MNDTLRKLEVAQIVEHLQEYKDGLKYLPTKDGMGICVEGRENSIVISVRLGGLRGDRFEIVGQDFYYMRWDHTETLSRIAWYLDLKIKALWEKNRWVLR